VISRGYDPTKLISKSLISLFRSSDYNIINLEAPITKSNTKINKTGPHLKSDINSIPDVLSALNIKLCTLANNHILDYSEQGVMETLAFCKENRIATVGAGKNKTDAARPHFINTDNGRIGIINIAENEWASATEVTAGSNGMNLIDDVYAIKKAKQSCDIIVVIVHGGHEYYNLPSPRMQKQYRFYIDNGADLVVGHHTHCVSGMEIYKDKEIYYSLGNFIFTEPSENSDWYKGVVLQIELFEKNKLVVTPKFVSQSREDFSIKLTEGTEYDEVYHQFNECTNIIGTRLDSSWAEFIHEKRVFYSGYWSLAIFVNNKYFKYLLLTLGIARITSKRSKSLFLNLIKCEAHSDLSKEVLIQTLSEKANKNIAKR
jgi:poly-gamma-glutamate synthesis protein (capsule biosynthesis protein)